MQREYETGSVSRYPEKYINIYDALENSSNRFPHKIAVIDDNKSITYKSLLEKVNYLAIWLRKEFNVKKGERVGLLFVNSIEFYIAFYALMKIGAIAVLVNTKMQTDEIAYTLGDTQTKCLIMNKRWLPKIIGLAATLKINRIITEEASDTSMPGVKMVSMEHILQEWDISEIVDFKSEQEENLTAVILHTSGTTGNPKGIMISHKNIMGTSYGYQDVLGLSESDITVLSVPVFHILGLSCVSTLFFYTGATIVVFEKFETNRVLEAIEKYHATHFHSVPAVYIKMIQEAKRVYNLESLRIAVCGGAVISEEYKSCFYSMAPNASFRIAYGLTETAGSGVLSYGHGEPGREVPNCQIRILEEKTGRLLDFGEGEAICEGPIVATRIWGRETEDRERLHTGDIIKKDSNGDIYILDRIKDVINRGGEKIFPSTIENAFLKYEGVEEAIAFPVSDELYGEVPAVVLVQKEGREIFLDDIWEDLPNKIGKFELPKYIKIWQREEVPLTGNGKVRKKRLREIFEHGLCEEYSSPK